MNTKLTVIIALVVVILVVVYFLIFEEWSWKKVITWISVLLAAIMPVLLINNYRIFIIAIVLVVIFEYKNLSQH